MLWWSPPGGIERAFIVQKQQKYVTTAVLRFMLSGGEYYNKQQMWDIYKKTEVQIGEIYSTNWSNNLNQKK